MQMSKDVVYKFKKPFQNKLISAAIHKAGSQRKLSKLLNIPKGCISSYKSCRNLIPNMRLKKFLNYLNYSYKDIFPFIVEKLPTNWGAKLGAKIIQKKL